VRADRTAVAQRGVTAGQAYSEAYNSPGDAAPGASEPPYLLHTPYYKYSLSISGQKKHCVVETDSATNGRNLLN
jgi:hypothetical protein